MNFRHIRNIVLVALAIAGSVACKKKEEESKKFLSGSMTFVMEPYAKPGDTFKLTPSGVTHPEDKPIGYYWTISKLIPKADTTRFQTADDPRDGSFEFTVKDTLGTFTVTGSAFATDYYSSSGSMVFTVVKAGLNTGSLTGIDIVEGDDEIFYDSREGQAAEMSYYFRYVGGTQWMKQNLAYTTADAPKGLAYQDSEAISDVLGRYYSWEEAKTVCPSGWHLPSEAELMALAQTKSSETLEATKAWPGCSGAFMSYVKFNDADMWEYWPAVKVTDALGLSLIPAGYCNLEQKRFQGIKEIAAIWTSDEYDADNGVYRYIIADQPDMQRGAGNKKSFGASVRCVAD